MSRGLRRTLGWVLCLACAGTASLSAGASAGTIERVRVTVEGETLLPVPLRARIEASVTSVMDRLTLGQSVAMVQERQEEYEGVVREVFGRVLTGYRLVDLVLTVDAELVVAITLGVDGTPISRVDTSVLAPGLSEEGQDLLEEALRPCRTWITPMFVGVPAEALGWASSALLPALEEALREEFPGFRPEVTCGVAGETLSLLLTMTPVHPVVESLVLDLSSATLSRFLVRLWRDRAWNHLRVLQGLPVAFLRRHQVWIEETSARRLAGDPGLAKLGLDWQVRLHPGITTRARVQVDAALYSLTARGTMELGDPPVLGLALRAALRPADAWELGGEILLDAGGLGLDLRGSMAYSLSPEMDLGLTYTTRAMEHRLWLRFASGRGDLFILGKELVSGTVWATMGLEIENQLTATLTVDSTRHYSLSIQVGL